MSSTTYPQHISSIPYTSPPTRLQTLDIWLPRALSQAPANALWIVYVHGGAWRDPLQTSLCAEPIATHLFSPTHTSTIRNIAGIASLNYRFSPYPSHPTDPSSPSDPDRNVAHPAHVQDIARGIEFLEKEYGLKRWIGMGHSCGATMLLQYVSGTGVDRAADSPGGPEALILTAGIYNIPLLLQNHSPPSCPENISMIYADIIRGAFGSTPSTYHSVSPVAGKYGTETWANGKLIVLAHSHSDEMVERAQRDVMCVALDREGWSIVMEDGDEEAIVQEGRRVLEVRDIKGPHDFIWENGEESAKLIAEVVDRMMP